MVTTTKKDTEQPPLVVDQQPTSEECANSIAANDMDRDTGSIYANDSAAVLKRQVFVLSGDKTYTIQVEADQTNILGEIVDQTEAWTSCLQPALFFGGRPVRHDATPNDMNLQPGSTLTIMPEAPLRGGNLGDCIDDLCGSCCCGDCAPLPNRSTRPHILTEWILCLSEPCGAVGGEARQVARRTDAHGARSAPEHRVNTQHIR